jgi:hypothetical protein
VAGNGKAFAKLDAIISKINKLSTGQFQKDALRDVGSVMYDLAETGIAAGRNPRGTAWKPLSPNTANKGQPLRIAASSLHKMVSQAMARLSVNFPHAQAQNRGARRVTHNGKAISGKQIKALSKDERKSLNRGWKLPARSMLPKGGRLPPKWRDAIEAAMRKRFGQLWSQG